MATVYRAYRYRFYPTSEQLARTFGCVRYVYNHLSRLRSRVRQSRMPVSVGAAGRAIARSTGPIFVDIHRQSMP